MNANTIRTIYTINFNYIIKGDEFADVADVMNHGTTLQFKNLAFRIKEIEKDTPFISCGVEINGISTNISPDHLLAVFENPRMSGGDECEDFFFDPENKKAVVTYKSAKGRPIIDVTGLFNTGNEINISLTYYLSFNTYYNYMSTFAV